MKKLEETFIWDDLYESLNSFEENPIFGIEYDEEDFFYYIKEGFPLFSDAEALIDEINENE